MKYLETKTKIFAGGRVEISPAAWRQTPRVNKVAEYRGKHTVLWLK